MSPVKTRRSSTVIGALDYCRDNGYPVRIQADYVLGGWDKTARTEEEARTLIRRGLDLSPVTKVTLSWPAKTS